MKTYVHLSKHLADFFLEWEIFRAKVAEKIKTQFYLYIFFPPQKIVLFMR